MYIYSYKSLMKSLFANIADLSRKKATHLSRFLNIAVYAIVNIASRPLLG